jgi:predicted alpha/beta-hydrolase family hydrolase
MTHEMKFLATPEKGEVSALLVRPQGATHLLVLGHGASTDMRHATVQTIAERLAGVDIATFRYNFPYSENGKGRDSQVVCTATVRSAVKAASEAVPGLPLLAGGHSFGGRMTSTAASESPLEGVRGLAFFSFPLHLAGKPETKRADHLASVTVPMLFLSGSRDELAGLDLLRPVCERLSKRATLHVLDTADHGYKVLKKSRAGDEDVFVEMARVVRDWASKLVGREPAGRSPPTTSTASAPACRCCSTGSRPRSPTSPACRS